jgi:hypothetical protein
MEMYIVYDGENIVGGISYVMSINMIHRNELRYKDYDTDKTLVVKADTMVVKSGVMMVLYAGYELRLEPYDAIFSKTNVRA